MNMRCIWGTNLPKDMLLWKYMRVERFTDLLSSRRLYFAATSQFSDPFEGAVAAMPPDFPVDPRYQELYIIEKAFEELRRLTKVCCWHRSDYENSGMWNLYSASGKGIAICSTPKLIDQALEPFRIKPEDGIEDLYYGDVRYVDLFKSKLDATNVLSRFFHKHHVFEWEQEFRLAISLRLAEEFGVVVPEAGIEVKVDPLILINRIVIGPKITKKQMDFVFEYAASVGLSGRVDKTGFLGRPRYI